MGQTPWPCTSWPSGCVNPPERQRGFRPSGPGTMEGRAKSLPSPLSVADRGPPVSLELGLLPAPTPSCLLLCPDQANPAHRATGPHFLSPLASSWCPCPLSGQGQWDTAFLGDAWNLTAVTPKCGPMSSIENTGTQSHSHGKRTLLALPCLTAGLL